MKGKRGLLVVHLMEDRVRLLAGRAGLWSSDIAQVADLPGDPRSQSGNREWSNTLFREMEQLALRNGLRNPLVVVALSRGLLFWRTFQVPPVPRENLDSLIGFEVDKHLPTKREDLVFRCLPLTQAPTGWDILLAGTRRDLLQPVEEALEMLGLRASAVLPDLTGLIRLLRQRGQGDDGGVTALVSIDTHSLEVAVLRDDLPVYYRRIGGPPPPTETDTPDSRAEQITRIAGETAAAITGALGEAAANLTPGAAVTRGWLFADAGSDLVLQRLAETTTIPWQALRPEDLPAPGPQPASGEFPRLQVTAGLALGALEAQASPLNLLRSTLVAPTGRAGWRVTAILACLLAAVSLFHLGSLDYRRERRLADLEHSTSMLKGKVAAVKKLGERARREEARLKSMEEAVTRRVTTVGVLRELTRIIPASAYLIDVKIKKGTVEMNGLADSASGLISQLEASPLFKNVAFDAPITSQGPKERFKIKLALE